MDETFNEILEQALHHGIIDIWQVITWQVNGTPSDEIVEELTEKVRTQRPMFI